MRQAEFPVDPEGGLSLSDSLDRAVACLQTGGIVAFPTETSYGLAVDPFNEKALLALFRLKARDHRKPVLVLIRDIEQLGGITQSVPVLYRPLMERFWPGPLTLIFPGRRDLIPLLTGGTGTIGVRVSSNAVATELCRRWGGPITATSANISGAAPLASANAVAAVFGHGVDWVVDGGSTPGGGGSTIVGIEDGRLRLVRGGLIDFSMILNPK